MRHCLIYIMCVAFSVGLNAQRLITLDLQSAVDCGLYTLDPDKGNWTETFNTSVNTLTFNDGMFNFSHIPGHFGGDDVGGGMSYWDGFTLCNSGDTTDYGSIGSSDGWVAQQWGCMAGGGLNDSMEAEPGRAYLVGYWGYYYETNGVHACQVDFDGELHKVKGVYVCNHPWPYYGNIHGDGFSSPFTDEDSYFSIVAHGLLGGEDTGSSVTLVLAQNQGDGQQHGDNWPLGLEQSADWQWMPLDDLGEVDGVYFTMETTDFDPIYGANTAVYFCLDRMQIYESSENNAPQRPSRLTVSEVGEEQATLRWADNDDANRWLVYLNDSLVGEAEDTMFVYTSLAPYTEYTLKVVAVNEVGVSDPASVTVRTIDETPPTAPSNLVAEALGPYSISLKWDESVDNVATVRYRVYLNGVQEARPKGCQYVITGLEPETEYTIAVEAIDASGNVSAQATLTAHTADDPLGLAELRKENKIETIYTIDGRVVDVRNISDLPYGLYIINGKTVKVRK